MNSLDLFSGIGGFALGLKWAGINTVAFCEKDNHCKEVLNKNFPTIPIHDDIKSLDGSKFKNIDLITGGFPCQDISFAGSMKGIAGKRSSLWKEYLRVITEARPRYAIIENVEYLRKNGLGVVLNDLARIGYDAEWGCITANSVNRPHQRKRLFVISYPRGSGQHEHIGKERHLQINKEWTSEKIYSDGEQRELEPREVRTILSRGAFNLHRDTLPDERANVSGVRRVTDGVPERLDENRRKQRIKQLGNSVVPQIAFVLGRIIKDAHA